MSLVSLTAGLVGLWFYSQMLCPPPTPPVLQRPNDSATQILRLAERIQRLNPLYDINSSGAHPGAAGDELRQLYDNVLERLEAWTEMRFEPIEQPTEDDWQFEFGWHPLFELCESIEAEWREAIANDNYERAFNLVVANLRLSALRLERYEISLGSYLADNTINESLAYVIDGRKSLTDRQISILASTICEMERRHPSPEQVFARQRNIQREQTRHRWQFDLMSVLTNRDEMRLDYAQQSHDLWMAKNRLLRTDLAIRQYRKTQGKWPESIVELVPEFLEKLLIDPYSNASLVYRIEGDEFVLYSVGQDQVDHGGRFGSVADQFSDGFDLDIDTFTRPLGVIVEPKVRSESERGRGEKHEDAKGTKGEAG